MASSPDKIKIFQDELLKFGWKNGRHALPWRKTRDPWQLLMAEVLLRKTTSSQAAAIFEVIKNFSPREVVDMPLSTLEDILKPIGLYKVRAAGLKVFAKRILAAEPSAFGSDEFLQSLPGVGRYISNSVRCCAFDIPAPALDTNMIRIIQRVFGWISTRKRLREDRILWTFAETLVPCDNARDYNWAVLDFGAAVCTAIKPKCLICPLQDICDYYQNQSAKAST